MRDLIIEITCSPLPQSQWTTLATLEEDDVIYNVTQCFPDQRANELTRFIKSAWFPHIFQAETPDTWTLQSDWRSCLDTWYDHIADELAKMRQERTADTAFLRHLIDSPFKNNARYILPDYVGEYSEPGSTLLDMLTDLPEGQKLYIGAVFSYKYY